MVKKIRKRIEKEQPETGETPIDELDIDEGSPEGFVADIERFAEDSLTRGIVNMLKLVHQYGKVIIAVSAIGIGSFAFTQLNEMSEQEEISAKQTVVATALVAMETGRGLSSDTTGSKSPELDDAAKKGKLEAARSQVGCRGGGEPLLRGEHGGRVPARAAACRGGPQHGLHALGPPPASQALLAAGAG